MRDARGTARARVARVSAVVVSQGNRPGELSRCLESLHSQRRVQLDVLVVGSGWSPADLDPGVVALSLAENVGPPAARNLGLHESAGAIVLFLDDDAWLDDPDVLRRAAALFGARPRLGAVQLRIKTPDGRTLRRWVPRARVGDPARSGPAFALAEGVTLVRRAALDEVGGWAAQYFYGHEGIDLAWRLWDAGWEVHYAGDLVARHPATQPSRHADYQRYNARNRVWTARRNLPLPLIPVYLGSWAMITVMRLARDRRALRNWWGGFSEGWRTDPGRRRPMRWRTVAKLARLGQPPVV